MVGWKSLTWRWCWSKHCYSHSIDDREEEDDDDDDVLARAILTEKLISVRYRKIEFWHRFSIRLVFTTATLKDGRPYLAHHR